MWFEKQMNALNGVVIIFYCIQGHWQTYMFEGDAPVPPPPTAPPSRSSIRYRDLFANW